MRHNRILIIAGTHLRHIYFANILNDEFNLAGIVFQKRENILPKTPKLNKIDKKNFERHFKDRDRAEKKYFEIENHLRCEKIEISLEELNSKKTLDFIKKVQPDLILTFGCGIIKEPLLSLCPIVNLHLGLSPRYKGSATLFWPFYFLEPNHAGATIHYIIKGTDDGDIIHQVVPYLSMKDGIHDIACKVVIKAVEEIIKLLKLKKWRSIKQNGNGKLFLQSDFRPEHLRLLYNTYNNDIIKEYLEGNITSKTPKLFNQYEKISKI